MINKKGAILWSLSGLFALFICIMAGEIFFGSDIRPVQHRRYLYIPSGSDFERALDTLKSNLEIRNLKVFIWMAKRKNYPLHIKSGRYEINKKISYNRLLNMLRSGHQVPVKFTFSNIRTINQLAGKIGSVLEADSSRVMEFFNDESNYLADGFDKANIISLFIPDTYELYWDTDAASFYKRMLTEYKSFWNDQRISRARELGLSQKEISILASIVDDEVAKSDEKPRIAGVYLNRIRRGIPLQACPTIKFALNDFTITRVLNKHLLVDSPYNTYIHNGFPPGPVRCASIEGIDAVLNAEHHDYLFFAAKADFSGYHNFSRTLAEHNHYAAMYQRELDKRKIFR
jgi:UPF0755 protein